MSLEKPRKLMEVLHRRTLRGEIDWQESLPDMFQVSFKDNSVQLRSFVHHDQDAVTYLISLLNSEGTIVDTFSDEDLDRADFASPGGKWSTKIAELYATARRRARGADKLLDDILKEVGDDDIPL
jgi:hypothetical protein